MAKGTDFQTFLALGGACAYATLAARQTKIAAGARFAVIRRKKYFCTKKFYDVRHRAASLHVCPPVFCSAAACRRFSDASTIPQLLRELCVSSSVPSVLNPAAGIMPTDEYAWPTA